MPVHVSVRVPVRVPVRVVGRQFLYARSVSSRVREFFFRMFCLLAHWLYAF